jgi:hypothetical protein
MYTLLNYKKGLADIYFACSVASSKSHGNKYPPTPTKGKEIIKLLSFDL